MTRLSDELSDLGFATSDFRDPYYAKFVSKMALHTEFHKDVLTLDEQREQDAIAEEIIDQILREETARMRFIDMEGKRPCEAWLRKSDELTKQLIELHREGEIEARNKLISDNSVHWGEIKDWLLSLSSNKCWFSEARDIFSHMDVEHFRPKLEAKSSTVQHEMATGGLLSITITIACAVMLGTEEGRVVSSSSRLRSIDIRSSM